jgi:hypothetical protein
VLKKRSCIHLSSAQVFMQTMTFTSDELILALISLVRATHPGALHQEADGFSVDFEAIERDARGKKIGDDERLLLKMRVVLDAPQAEGVPLVLELEAAEGQRLAKTLASLEALQPWPPDVIDMSRGLRARLTSSF